jgi:Flp pilus assembly pilin Flp
LLAKFLRGQAGTAVAEYALIIALVAATVIGTLAALGRGANSVNASAPRVAHGGASAS